MKAKTFPLLEALEAQALSCTNAGSPLYGSLLAGLIDDYRSGGVTSELLEGVSSTPMHDAVPLRYLATAHRLALAGAAPTLARWYRSCGGAWRGEDISDDFLQVAQTHRSGFFTGLQRNVRPNEGGGAPGGGPGGWGCLPGGTNARSVCWRSAAQRDWCLGGTSTFMTLVRRRWLTR